MRLTIATIALLTTLAAAASGERAIDAAHSRARFSVSHIWVERVIGTVPIVSGSVSLAAGSVIPVSVSAVLDATQISTGEPDRDHSLESPDFFDAGKFPRWTFASTKVVPASASAFEMDGNLTIHGVTRPERLQVTVAGTESSPTYHAAAQIDRRSFGMAVTRLDPVIGSVADVTLDVMLQ